MFGNIRCVLLGSVLLAAARPSVVHPSDINPFDAEQQRLASTASRRGLPGQAAVALLEMWRHWDYATPERTESLLRGLAENRRLAPTDRAHAAWLAGLGAVRLGRTDEIEAARRRWWFVDQFRVLGPFDNEGKTGLAADSGPESTLTKPFDPAAEWPGKDQSVRWRSLPQVNLDGYVDLAAVFRPNENACGFAETVVRSERPQPLSLWVGAGGGLRLWWNGQQVLEDDKYRRPYPDRHAVVVQAQAGINRLRLKVCVVQGQWGFFLRLGDGRGEPPSGLHFELDAAPAAVSAGPTAPTPAATPAATPTVTSTLRSTSGSAALQKPAALRSLAVLQRLEALVQKQPPQAEALVTLAKYLAYSGADDLSEKRAEELAAQAVEAEVSVPRLLLAAELATERSDARRLAQQAQTLAPADPRVRLLQAQVLRRSVRPEDALAVLTEIDAAVAGGPPSMVSVQARSLRAELLVGLGLPQTALKVLSELNANFPEAAAWRRQRAEVAQIAGHRDGVIEWRRKLLQSRYDDLESRRVLIDDAVQRGDVNSATEHLSVLLQLTPLRQATLLYAAAAYESLGDVPAAHRLLARALSIAPRDADVHVAEGRLLLWSDQRDAAVQAFEAALRIRPQDAEIRELLESIRPAKRADEAYAVDSRVFLSRRSDTSGYAATTLQDLSVQTVYQSGLKSLFRQVVVQVHDQEGAQRWGNHSIAFDPAEQRVDLRLARVYRRSGQVLEATRSYEQSLSEPWYRVYYDRSARVVVFPSLQPGDVVELRYRIDDVAQRNLFADYFGDLRLLQNATPIRQLDYLLVTPKDRTFFHNAPALATLHHESRLKGSLRVDHWTAKDVAALQQEENMPAGTEVIPYLHVSSYRTWKEVGHWYWGLIKDQLYADDSLKKTVAELVRGVTDKKQALVRIHNWVVQHTRYVALEFGIHGYLPYRVPQVVRRGFGDCKDKAALLFTMLREAGIEANFALVRTRDNGAIADLPASLAIFDHAIVYVPGFDLYLDGTAEHNGTAELPYGDQGVTVLLVGPRHAELRQTPVLPAASNQRWRRVRLQLQSDGSAEAQIEERVAGLDAASARQRFHAEGTRRERLENSLRSLFPGLEVRRYKFQALETLESPVTVDLQARLPQVGQRQEDRWLLASTALQPLLPVMARTPARVYDLELGAPRIYEEERIFVWPQGMVAAELPKQLQLSSPFGEVTLQVHSTGPNELHVRSRFALTSSRISTDDYPAFRDWLRSADAGLQRQLSLVLVRPSEAKATDAKPKATDAKPEAAARELSAAGSRVP